MRGAIGCMVLTAALLGGATPGALAQVPFTATQDPLAGARLFTDKGCVTCHAISGRGGTVGPDLGRVTRPRTFYDLAAALWNHAPAMAARMRQRGIARPRLTAQESGDLAAYLFTLSYFDAPGDPEAGRRLFTAKRCALCHRVGGAGGSVGPPLDGVKAHASPIALAAVMWNHAPRMAAAMEAQGVERPTFSGSELLDLIAYLNRVSPTPPTGPLPVLPGRAAEGGRLFAQRGCVECHSAGRGGREGTIDLAEREANKSLVEFAAAMWNKMPRMTEEMRRRSVAFRPLQPEEMADIVAFLYAARYFAQAGDPRNGVTLATYKGCLGCHALYGERDKPASDLAAARGIGTPAGVLSALWNHSFITDPRPARERTPWPTFTGPEMADLVAYLRSLPRSR
ncbi:MAG TPA: c-type cytochrome [Methylomirabilota bacterium]|nr:c-type cytochrome [Methylomirabilota bacterium]